MRLAVRHVDWASEAMGESLYMHTLWILKWKGNDSFGSKTYTGNQVETELRISIWDSGGAGDHFHQTMVGEVKGEFRPTRVGEPIRNVGNIDGVGPK